MYLSLRNSRIKLSVGQIFWREIGSGPDVVFLHGSWQDSTQWLPVIEHLSTDHHCFVPDLLGFGESQSESPKIHYSVELEVEFLADYLENLKLRQFYLVAHSLGGWIAANYAIKHSDRVLGLVLLAPEGVKAGYLKQRWFWMSLFGMLPSVILRMVRSLSPIAKICGGRKNIDRLLQFQKGLIKSPTTAKILFQRRRREIQGELLDARLSELKIPILILQGAEDTAITLSLSQSYTALAPNAEIQVVSNGGNNLPQEMPEAIAQYIRKFVNG
ncbi:alpha/beta hydrolase [Oscillatoriales cyanobacterium USR001]|nr:alpha/beta hydrolase [Oscillatoriales cyanobacterium USR001]